MRMYCLDDGRTLSAQQLLREVEKLLPENEALRQKVADAEEYEADKAWKIDSFSGIKFDTEAHWKWLRNWAWARHAAREASES